MSRAGDVIENPVTGERVVVRVGTEETRGELLVVEGFIKPGGAVSRSRSRASVCTCRPARRTIGGTPERRKHR